MGHIYFSSCSRQMEQFNWIATECHGTLYLMEILRVLFILFILFSDCEGGIVGRVDGVLGDDRCGR